MTASTPGHRYAYIQASSNRKLGGLPATTTSKDSCPITCSYNPASGGGGCYAAQGPMEWQWRKLDDPNNDKALNIHQLAERLSRLRKHTLFRLNQAGTCQGMGWRSTPPRRSNWSTRAVTLTASGSPTTGQTSGTTRR